MKYLVFIFIFLSLSVFSQRQEIQLKSNFGWKQDVKSSFINFDTSYLAQPTLRNITTSYNVEINYLRSYKNIFTALKMGFQRRNTNNLKILSTNMFISENYFSINQNTLGIGVGIYYQIINLNNINLRIFTNLKYHYSPSYSITSSEIRLDELGNQIFSSNRKERYPRERRFLNNYGLSLFYQFKQFGIGLEISEGFYFNWSKGEIMSSREIIENNIETYSNESTLKVAETFFGQSGGIGITLIYIVKN